jgi:hypothetical protein
MKRLLLVGALGLTVMATGLRAEEKGTKYGNGVTLSTSVTVAELLATPDAYLGKTVRVDGVVASVCEHMGCWIQIADHEGAPGIQFKVEDGVIVFPKDGQGRRASAEGVFESMPAETEHAAANASGAHEHGDPKEATPVEPPQYRVKATGAVLF